MKSSALSVPWSLGARIVVALGRTVSLACDGASPGHETTMEDASVKAALAKYTRIKVQAEDPDRVPAPVRELMNDIGAVGLPAYAILEPKPSTEASAR